MGRCGPFVMHERGGQRAEKHFCVQIVLDCLRIHIFISWIYISSWFKKKIQRCCRRMGCEGKWGLVGSNQFLSYLQHLCQSCVSVCDSVNASALPSPPDPQSQREELWCLRSVVLFTNRIKEEKQRQEMDPLGIIPVWAVNKERSTLSEQIKIQWNSSFKTICFSSLLFLRLPRPPEFRDDPWPTEMVRLPLALRVSSFLSWHTLWEMQSSPGASQVVLVVNNPSATAGDIRDTGSIPGSGRSPGGGRGNPLQCSCLENPMDRGAWRAIVHRVAKSQTRLNRLSTNTWTSSP